MILIENWPKTAKSSWHCPFNIFPELSRAVAFSQDFPVFENQMPIENSRTFLVFQDSYDTLFNNSQPCCIDRLIFRSIRHFKSLADIPAWPVRWKITQYFVQESISSISFKKAAKILQNAEKIIDINECTKTCNLLNTLMLRYLRKVQRICSEFLADMSNVLPFILCFLCCDWNFSPRE